MDFIDQLLGVGGRAEHTAENGEAILIVPLDGDRTDDALFMGSLSR